MQQAIKRIATPLTTAELSSLRIGRQNRMFKVMETHKCDAILLTDPVHIRYACDARNMSLFHMRNPVRFFLGINNGPRILYESTFGDLSNTENFETIDETLPTIGFTYTCSAQRNNELFNRWYKEILSKLNKYNCKNIAIEGKIGNDVKYKFNNDNNNNFNVMEATEIMEKARYIKSFEEIKCIKYGIDVVADAYKYMLSICEPGITENELWSHFHQKVIANDGEYIETRLMASGDRTNPWYQECSMKKINENEIIAFDTDTVGCYGYYIDFSRSWICPSLKGGKPSSITMKQKELMNLAYEQVQYNLSLIKPGLSFKELTYSAWEMPDEYIKHRNAILAHGIGLTGEYPYFYHKYDYDEYGYDGEIKEGMTMCVESFIGHESGEGEGVKYEEQILVTNDGIQILTEHIPIEPYFFE